MSQERQNKYLEALREQRVAVAVYLVNGIKLQGTIVSYDDNVILLGSSTSNQMIYKRAVSTVVPMDAFDFEDFDQQGNV